MMRLYLVTSLLVFSSPAHSFFWSSSKSQDTRGAPGSPLVFIPGTGASQLEAKIDREQVVASHCPKQEPWNRVWLDVWQLLAGGFLFYSYF